MKYHLFLPALFAFALLVPGCAAQAHVLEIDNGVKGVMHINPSHEPTAGEPAEFEFFMSGDGRAFDPEAYRYALSVAGPDGATSTAPVLAYGSTLKAKYAFPKEGEYTATLTGSSAEQGVPGFTLSYDDIRVLPPGHHENPVASFFGTHGAHALLTGILILILVAVFLWDRLITPRLKRKS